MLEEASDFTETVFRNLPRPVFVKDHKLRYVLVNDAFCILTGRGEDELLGHTAAELFRPEEAEAIDQRARAVLESGEPTVSKLERFTDAKGQSHLLTTTRVLVSGTSSGTRHVVGVVDDVTELHAHQAKLEAAKASLERRVAESREALKKTQDELLRRERLAALGQLSAGIAHQIRNPLAAISNATAILRRKMTPEDGSDGDRVLSIIHEEVKQANSIITGLLNYARVGPASLRPVPLDELVDASTAIKAPPEGVELHCAISEGATVQADPEQLMSALGNILANAYEAMPEGGTVRIEASAEGNQWLLAISDSGPGIDPEEYDLVFQPLMSHKPAGTGLGLSIARVLVENQGGSLEAGAAPGGGARFLLSLHRVSSEEEGPPPRQRSS